MSNKIGRNELCPCQSGKKYKYCHINKKLPLLVEPLESERFIITVENKGKRYKAFQIFFLKDTSICVDFPYFAYSEGIASQALLEAGRVYPTDIKLSDSGKATSHLVKYSHHPDGRAHFSQTGKVVTTIKKMACPLREINGHFFTIMLQGMSFFEEVTGNRDIDKKDRKRGVINFNTMDREITSLKFLCYLYPMQWLKENISLKGQRNLKIGSIISIKLGDSDGPFFVLSNTQETDDKYVLLLSCKVVPSLNKTEEAALSFIGGFDSGKIGLDHSQDTSFLALLYPIKDLEKMREKIGTMDYIK